MMQAANISLQPSSMRDVTKMERIGECCSLPVEAMFADLGRRPLAYPRTGP